MADTLRTRLIRIASSLPAGSQERKAVLELVNDRQASFGFAHKPLMDAKAAIEAGDKVKAKALLDAAGKAVTSLSSSKAVRAHDFLDDLLAQFKKM